MILDTRQESSSRKLSPKLENREGYVTLFSPSDRNESVIFIMIRLERKCSECTPFHFPLSDACNLSWHLKILTLTIDLYVFLFAVNALIDIKKSLIDPKNNLKNWNKGDPCARDWTGVWCFDKPGDDGHFHVRELYGTFFLLFSFCS